MIDGEISCYGGPGGDVLGDHRTKRDPGPVPDADAVGNRGVDADPDVGSNPAIPGNMCTGGYKRPCTQLGAVSNMDQMVQLDTLLKQRNICGENALGHPALGTDFHRIFNYHESHIF